MALEAWPSILPQPQKNFEHQGLNGLNDDAEDLWPERLRSNPESQASYSFIMSASQYSVFETFYKAALNGGCKLFTASWLSVSGFENHRARFAAPYAATYLGGGQWSVQIKIEIITVV